MTLPDLGWLDWVLLTIVVASIAVGIVRGFVFECLSLAGWIVAWFGSLWAAPQLAPSLPVGTPGSALNLAAALLLCFVVAIVVWTLLARLVRMVLHATPLSLPDRLLGGGFGAVRGGVVLLALAAVVTLTPLARSEPWRTSTGARWLGDALVTIRPLLPDAAARLYR